MEAARLGEVGSLITSPSTAHISAADLSGLACSITVSAGYGSGAMPAGTGIWLNNSLGELELHPAGYHGLPPGTRLVSNMAPTTVRHDGGALAIGSPGADRITTALSSVLLNHLVVGMSLDEAVTHPRVHAEVFDAQPTIAAEPGVPLGAIDDMVLRPFPNPSMYFGGVTAARSHPVHGLSATSDPRRAGAIAAGG
jgi:gamma-glutamyltranspeptidase/glutathione hydrolase